MNVIDMGGPVKRPREASVVPDKDSRLFGTS